MRNYAIHAAVALTAIAGWWALAAPDSVHVTGEPSGDMP
jgi:hypothetical protein